MTTLQDRAMLVTLTISEWTNRRYDKQVSAEVETTHGAKDAGRYNKILVDRKTLEPISKVLGAAYAYHIGKTLPWADKGDRLLPGSLFMDYTDSMRQYKSEVEKRVNDFKAIYPQLVQDARNRLKTMYNPADYPDVKDIGERFAINVSFSPVPSAGDFRVNLNEEYVESIKSEITERTNARQVEALNHCWSRIRDVVGKIHERLADQDAVFRDSLISNARELVEVLPHLNLTNDPALAKAEAEVRALLLDPAALRTNPSARSETAKRAADILSRLPWTGGN